MRRIRFTLIQLLMTVALVAIGLTTLRLATCASKREEISDLVFFGSSHCLAVQRYVWHERDGKQVREGTGIVELLDVVNNSRRAIRTCDEQYLGYRRETLAVDTDGASLLLLPDTPACRSRVLKWSRTSEKWDAVFTPHRFARVLLYWEGEVPPKNHYERLLVEKWNCVRFSPSHKVVVYFGVHGCFDDGLSANEIGSTRCKWSNEDETEVSDLSWFPDGRRFAVEANNRIDVFDTETGKLLKRKDLIKLGPITSLAVSPDGQAMATGHKNGMINIWDGTTFQRFKTFTPQRPVQLSWAVPKIAFGVWYFTALILWRRRRRKKSALKNTLRSDAAGPETS